jgi:hypothetical protein
MYTGGTVRDASRRCSPCSLFREFGATLGSRTHIKGLVSRLRPLGFLGGHGEVIEAGPLLELGVDGEHMIADLLARGGDGGAPEDPAHGAGEEQILEVLARLGGNAAMKDLTRETGETLLAVRREVVSKSRELQTKVGGESQAARPWPGGACGGRRRDEARARGRGTPT